MKTKPKATSASLVCFFFLAILLVHDIFANERPSSQEIADGNGSVFPRLAFESPLPPSPQAAMASALKKGAEAMEEARRLDAQRKQGWIEDQETIRDMRRQSDRLRQIVQEGWSGAMSHEDWVRTINEEEKYTREVAVLDREARERQKQYVFQIQKLLVTAHSAEETARIIHEEWVRNHGKAAIEAATSRHQQMNRTLELNRIRLDAARGALENARRTLDNSLRERERLILEEKNFQDRRNRNAQVAREQLHTEERRAEGFMIFSTVSHEDLMDSLDREKRLKERMERHSDEDMAMEGRFRERIETLNAGIQVLEKEVRLKEERLQGMERESATLGTLLQAQSAQADALARLAEQP
ncbi:MAG: hypothetical protein HQL76_05195 [Magnetococcales bacterium]|nr:hypothetical protein [Magnetococcales bacterium]